MGIDNTYETRPSTTRFWLQNFLIKTESEPNPGPCTMDTTHSSGHLLKAAHKQKPIHYFSIQTLKYSNLYFPVKMKMIRGP